MPWLTVATWFQALFTGLSPYFSAFSHDTKFAIGLGTYLELDVSATQLPTAKSGSGTQDTRNLPSHLSLRDYHPLWYRTSTGFRVDGLGSTLVLQPHIHLNSSLRCLVCPVPVSLAATPGIAIAFFSSPY